MQWFRCHSGNTIHSNSHIARRTFQTHWSLQFRAFRQDHRADLAAKFHLCNVSPILDRPRRCCSSAPSSSPICPFWLLSFVLRCWHCLLTAIVCEAWQNKVDSSYKQKSITLAMRERKLTWSSAKISEFVSSNDCLYPDEHWIPPVLCSSTFAMRIVCAAIASSVDGVCRWCPDTVWTARTAQFFLFR